MFRKQPAPDSTRLLPAGLQGFQLRGGSGLAACLQTYTATPLFCARAHSTHHSCAPNHVSAPAVLEMRELALALSASPKCRRAFGVPG